jgi:hypothetical protein
VGHEFYGDGSFPVKPFRTLKVLKFRNMRSMRKWEAWFSFDPQNEGRAFPNLRELYIEFCPQIRTLPIGIHRIVSLDSFEIR